jgi:peptidoglycan/LPS O-acetylase OafA/YrhL
MLTGDRRLLGMGVLVALVALLLTLLAVLLIWEGWSTKPLDSLPTLYWLLYITWAGMSALMLIVIALGRPRSKGAYSFNSIFRDVFLFLIGLAQVLNNLTMPTWNGGRLFWLTAGIVFIILGAEGPIQFYIEKKRATK